jgi:hypothetical protein
MNGEMYNICPIKLIKYILEVIDNNEVDITYNSIINKIEIENL